MKAILFVALCVIAAASITVAQEQGVDVEFVQFMDWVKVHGKTYASSDEFLQRFANYRATVARVAAQNAASTDATFAVNKFADLSTEEFRAKYLGYVPKPKSNVKTHHHQAVHRPTRDYRAANVTSWDWRTKGAITPVKDQQQCGSCWAFSATEEIESAWFLSKKTLPVLSPQQIVSCDTTDAGCNGGDTITAYQYVQSAGGLESDSAYPYTSGGGDSGTCKFDKSKVVATVGGFTYATPPCTDSCTHQNETTLANSLLDAPVSICVYAESWQNYNSGILKTNCPRSYSDLDHCVQLVGFNFAGTTPYWIVRNSWNTDWGVAGYIYIESGTNLCGIADEATIVTI